MQFLHFQTISLFLDALASLGLMMETHSLTHSLTRRLEIYSPSDSSDPSDLITQNGMSLKMECHSKWNVTQNGMSFKMECHSKWNVTQNGMSLKMECHTKWNVTQNEMSLKM